MSSFSERFELISNYLAELLRFGVPERSGSGDGDIVVLVDGVGRFQAAVLMVRRALRSLAPEITTVIFSWQFGLPGEIWTDLMWLSRNKRMGRCLARKLIALRRAHRDAKIHLLAYSGGAGVAVFACEHLRGARLIDTFILACPALSPSYDLSRALRSVSCCYALVSEADNVVLGLGTRIFGTMDRRFESAAGRVGFVLPADGEVTYPRCYERLGQIRWTPAGAETMGHCGGHSGWATTRFLEVHLMGLLRGRSALPVESILNAAE